MKKILTIAFVLKITLISCFGQGETKLGNTRNISEKYVAFLVGANDYQYLPKLKYPIEDIKALSETLKDYSFKSENIISVENPTEEGFFQKTDELKEKVGKNDNLLVYISIHGVLNANEKYFWQPVDSKEGESRTWIFVRDFLDIIESIDCKHILLIIDSCYGGSLFSIKNTKSGKSTPDDLITQRDIESYRADRSALAITSGKRLKTVPDKSHFFAALNDVLATNKYEYLPVSRLFEKTRDQINQIQNNSNFRGIPVYPQLSKVNYLKDDGGQFVFYKKGGIPRRIYTDSTNDTDDEPETTPTKPLNSREFKVAKSIHRETINLNAGEKVEIIASGIISVGQFLKDVTPRGKEKGLLGLPIDEYDIVAKYPHGALMYRIAPDQSWNLCGDGCEIKAKKSGNMTIEFTINDNNTGDNSGNFDITLKKL